MKKYYVGIDLGGTFIKGGIVDGEGNILVEKVAEGTNTFLASFENPPIPTGSTCYYYAVAKDSGGNENTYCYHKQDIYRSDRRHTPRMRR